MSSFIKLSIRNAFIFSIYEMCLIWFLGIYTFQNEGVSIFNALASTLIYVFVLYLMSTQIVLKLNLISDIRRIVNASIFIVSSSLAGLIYCFVFGIGSYLIPTVMLGFIISSLVPAVGYFLYSFVLEKSEVLVIENSKDENVTSDTKEENVDVRFVLKNESGKKLFDTAVKNIICFEANDNYVVIYYLDNEGKQKKAMERISLKKIEEILTELNVTFFERVHKSYLINETIIEEVKGKAQAYRLKMKNLDLLIPVSRNYNVDKFRF